MKLCHTYIIFSEIFLIAVLATALSGCYYDKEELLFPNSQNCDSTEAKYSTTVLPILSNNCNSCHGGNFPSAGVKLDSYTSVSVHARNGRLYGTISHSPGYVPMPLIAPKLSNCNINAIKKWIDNGALNN